MSGMNLHMIGIRPATLSLAQWLHALEHDRHWLRHWTRKGHRWRVRVKAGRGEPA